MKPAPRRDPVWWHACAFCPSDIQWQNGHHAGSGNAFRPGDLTVVVLHGRRCPRLRRAHLLCLRFAVASGCTLPPVIAGPATTQDVLFKVPA